MPLNWLLDFDDTLVIGSIYYGIKVALPQVMLRYGLTGDEGKLHRLIGTVQAMAATGADEETLIKHLFGGMNWPLDAGRAVLTATFEEAPTTVAFEDVEPFLARVHARGDRVMVVSNNESAPQLLNQLQLGHLFAGVFTPGRCGVKHGKPSNAMWSTVAAAVDGGEAVMVGDDPWADGGFAEACGLRFVLVDRLGRFGEWTKSQRVRDLTTL